MAIVRTHDLELDQDLAFQRRSWVVQRAGWAAMAGLLVAALAGVFGSGPLSRGEVAVPGLLAVDYERFSRSRTSQTLTVRVEPAATVGPELRLWVARAFLAEVKVEAITPPPARVETAGDRLVYVFPVSRPRETAIVAYTLQPHGSGRRTGRVGLDGHPAAATFRQLVYP